MRRLIAIWGSALLFAAIFYEGPVYAEKRADHDADLEKVLFGDSKADTDQKNVAKALEAAAYLTIDQFGGNGQNSLNTLEKLVLDVEYPEIDDIDISSSETSHHREYTHQGWNSKYHSIEGHGENGEDEGEWPQKWKIRKGILEDTVDAIFGFSWWNNIPFLGDILPDHGQQADSLCALIYYTHLLGDHYETSTMEQYGYLLPVGGKLNQRDIIDELLYHCDVVFETAAEEYERTYSLFEDELRKVNTEYFKLGRMDQEKLDDNREKAERVLNILSEYIPSFLQKEDFYSAFSEYTEAA